jgi:hypothetical protein
MSEFGPVVSGDWLAAHLPEVLHEIRQRFRPALTEIPEEDVGRLAEQLDVLAQGLRGRAEIVAAGSVAVATARQNA